MFIVVLGGGIDLSGNLPPYVHQRLDKAIELYNQYKSCGLKVKSYEEKLSIVVCGKYSFLYDQLKRYPPYTECEKMAEYLLAKGIPNQKILLEKKSKDTISNAYYLKKEVFIPHKVKKAIIVTTKFHLPRVKYIFNKIFGSEFSLNYIGTDQYFNQREKSRLIAHQQAILEKVIKILSPMKDGDHHFLDGKFYTIKYYREKRPDWVINFVTQGK